MINTLDDYISHSIPKGCDFTTNPNLTKKVDYFGKILPYEGNTIVFLLNDKVKDKLRGLQELLYAAAPEMLAEMLRPDTFHMTLHDLANGMPDQTGLKERMAEVEKQARPIITQWKNDGPLSMKATWLFNMVNTSIVLGLAPADEESRQRLSEMYTRLESVVSLGYALTPHITMAYFKPGTYGPEQAGRLSAAIKKVELDVTLYMKNLVLQNFTDMNNYYTIG